MILIWSTRLAFALCVSRGGVISLSMQAMFRQSQRWINLLNGYRMTVKEGAWSLMGVYARARSRIFTCWNKNNDNLHSLITQRIL